jgi:hypothetical protein
MHKYLIIAILLSACVSTPPLKEYHYAYVETSGSWTTREIEDPLDGNWKRSAVFTEKQSWAEDNPGLFVDTYANGRSALFFTNGDGYICDLGSLKVRVKFDDEEVFSLNRYQDEFRLANNNERIALYDSGNIYTSHTAKSDFLAKLPKADSVIIETIDDCGTVKQMNFNIEGSPHYIAVDPLDSFKD